MLSASLCDSPSLHGVKIIAVGTCRATYTASWPGTRDDLPRAVAQLRRTLPHQVHAAGIERLGRDLEQLRQLQLHAAVARDEAGLARELRVQPIDLGVRRDGGTRRENRTSPGTTLRLFGDTSSCPTVPRPSSPRARIMRSTRSMIRAAHTSASLRADGGVVPACESWPMRDRIVPDLRLRAGDDADLLRLALQDRPLLDMQLEIGIGREGGGRLLARDSRCRPALCRTVTPSTSVSA